MSDAETDRIRRLYDDRAADYACTVGFAERLMLGSFRREFGTHLRGDTLEVAVGSGLNLPYYTPAVTRAIGVDLSSQMLRLARDRAAEIGLPIELMEADAVALPFSDDSFDTVAVSLALCTIPDPVQALWEMARVCRPDGQVVMLEHVLSPIGPIALVERLLAPLQERAMGCHLDRKTVDVARGLDFRLREERQRFFGVFRLVVADPPRMEPSVG